MIGSRTLQPTATPDGRSIGTELRASASPLLFGLRLWASVSLALYAAFWLQLDNPFWAGASAAIVCQPQLGASLRKGWFRMLGTLVGALMSVVLAAGFPQDRLLFLGTLALWGAACSFVATLLRNFASYAAALAGYTAAVIAGDLLGTVGGLDTDAAFLLAVTRATEICLGIVCAGVVLAGTDLGGARRQLAMLLSDLASEITHGLAGTLAKAAAGEETGDARVAVRGHFLRVTALNPIVDQALGESSQVRHYAAVLQRAVGGLLSALAGWHASAGHLARLSEGEAHLEAATVLTCLPQALRSGSDHGTAGHWLADPLSARRFCQSSAASLADFPATTPLLRLLADKTAEALIGMGDALDGLHLLVDDTARPARHSGGSRFHVPDWLPAMVSAARTFAAMSAMSLCWILTGWPGGALAMTFAAIVTLLLAPRSDETFGAALILVVGAILDLILISVVAFAILPSLRIEGFAPLSLVIGACLVPIGALLRGARKPAQVGLFTAMTTVFVPILQPTNPETYNPEIFYNVALPIVAGLGVAALSFRLLPPPSPAFRARRLLALSLRDLQRLASGRTFRDWASHLIARLAVVPKEAAPEQRTRLLAALAVGREIIRLRPIADRLGLGTDFAGAVAPLAKGRSADAVARLSRLDGLLALSDGPNLQEILRMRGGILVVSEALTRHAAYFDSWDTA